ncbi:MAG: hypothetical protein M3Y68_16665 [Chloroflexota bacterium]|nr:hypothetical protein [Chloroflexota bacterium]
MQQNHYEQFIKGTEYEAMFKSMEEKDRLLNNLGGLRRTLWEMRAQLCQLESALEASRDIIADADCLRAQLESTAERLDLQLSHYRRTDLS